MDSRSVVSHKPSWLHRLYFSVMRLAASPKAELWLAAVSFAESSFFPAPPDLMLVPMCMARRDRAIRYAVVCTIASVLGGLVGYAIGRYIGDGLLRLLGMGAKLEAFQALYAEVGVWVILVKGLTPIPYKLITIASGVARFDLGVFVAASLVTRAGRFLLVAILIKLFGASVQSFIEKRLVMVTTVFALLIVAGLLALKFI